MSLRIVNLCLPKLFLSGIIHHEHSRIDYLYAEFLLQMPSCHIMLQSKEEQLWAWEEGLYLAILRGFCLLKWFWVHLSKNKYFIVSVTDCTCVGGCHDKKFLLGFFISLMVTNLCDSGWKIQSWILLKKCTLCGTVKSVNDCFLFDVLFPFGKYHKQTDRQTWPFDLL